MKTCKNRVKMETPNTDKHDRSLSWKHLTQTYMTDHSLGSVQVLQYKVVGYTSFIVPNH